MALCKPTTPDPELQQRIKDAVAQVDAMTPAERQTMLNEQRKSFVRGMIGMGSDRDEAEYAAALRAGDKETLARLDKESAERVAQVDRILNAKL